MNDKDIDELSVLNHAIKSALNGYKYTTYNGVDEVVFSDEVGMKVLGGQSGDGFSDEFYIVERVDTGVYNYIMDVISIYLVKFLGSDTYYLVDDWLGAEIGMSGVGEYVMPRVQALLRENHIQTLTEEVNVADGKVVEVIDSIKYPVNDMVDDIKHFMDVEVAVYNIIQEELLNFRKRMN